jgi:transcriptional regulator with GAF, ATPase, and Fis domain
VATGWTLFLDEIGELPSRSWRPRLQRFGCQPKRVFG